MNEIKTKSGYSDIEVSYKFDKNADIVKTAEVFIKILREMGYGEKNIEDVFTMTIWDSIEQD